MSYEELNVSISMVEIITIDHTKSLFYCGVWSKLIITIFSVKWIKEWVVQCFCLNPHGAEISVIRLVERSAIKLLILYVTREEQTLRSREISNLIVTLLALIEIRFRSFFIDVEKRRQYSEVTTITLDLS